MVKRSRTYPPIKGPGKDKPATTRKYLERDIRNTRGARDTMTKQLREWRAEGRQNTGYYRGMLRQRDYLNDDLANYRRQLTRLKTRGKKGR